MKMLLLLGYSPELNQCVATHKKLGDEDELSFSVRLGGVLCGDAKIKDDFARPISQNTLKFLRLLQCYPLADVSKIKADPEILNQMSAVTSDFVEYVMEVRPKSLAVLGEL